ncbi:MAG: HlyD family efflux transporter periplasmic adaptor subunit, partial [Pirellulales bacterium]|nr:HlyD family efflux transporter periplasmic adaptor subunit [Pirellulales bacterium]
ARTHAELLNAPARPDEILMDKARIRAAQARLELARVELDRTKVRAPSDGQILDVEVEPGELTGPDVAQPAVVITDTSRYRVRAFIEEMDAPRVRQGMSVRVVADGLPGRALEGRVAQCCPRMGRKQLWSDDPAERYDTKTREVWVDLDSREDLIIGLRVDVVIDTESAAPIPSVSPSPEDGRPRTPIHAVRNLACASADPH